MYLVSAATSVSLSWFLLRSIIDRKSCCLSYFLFHRVILIANQPDCPTKQFRSKSTDLFTLSLGLRNPPPPLPPPSDVMQHALKRSIKGGVGWPKSGIAGALGLPSLALEILVGSGNRTASSHAENTNTFIKEVCE